MRRQSVKRLGLALIEVIVIIAVIAILLALFLTVANSHQGAARRAHCVNNLKRMALAMHAYHTAFDSFPPGYVSGVRGDSPTSPEFGPGWGWGALILGQMDQQELFHATNLSLAITDPGMVTVRSARPLCYVCPSMAPNSSVVTHARIRNGSGSVLANHLALSHYVASAGQLDLARSPGDNNGLFFRNSQIRVDDITDGTSFTMMIGERSPLLSYATQMGAVPSARVCTNPDFKPESECGPASVMILGVTGPDTNSSRVDTPVSRGSGPAGYHGSHLEVSNFAFADGSVKPFKRIINARTFSQLATRSGGETIDTDDY